MHLGHQAVQTGIGLTTGKVTPKGFAYHPYSWVMFALTAGSEMSISFKFTELWENVGQGPVVVIVE